MNPISLKTNEEYKRSQSPSLLPILQDLVTLSETTAPAQQTINDTIEMTGTTAATTTTYMEYAYNVITTASATAYAARLPNPPTKGKSCTIINTSGFPIVIYPSVTGGSINDVVDGNAVIPSDNMPYEFICYENPAPGSWSVILSQTDLLFNTRLGYKTLNAPPSGEKNTASGYFALQKNTTGSNNVGNGYYALFNNTTGLNNTAIGAESLVANTTGVGNVAIGCKTLFSNISGSGNIAIGEEAMKNSTGGGNNIGMGYHSLNSNTTGSSNIGFGSTALSANTTGSSNIGIGDAALSTNTTGSYNVVIGYSSLFNSISNENTVIGSNSLTGSSSGDYNSVVGYACQSGGFSGSTILGHSATATAANQFVVGSSSVNAGTITTEVVVSNKTWSVRINGVACKILLQV